MRLIKKLLRLLPLFYLLFVMLTIILNKNIDLSSTNITDLLRTNINTTKQWFSFQDMSFFNFIYQWIKTHFLDGNVNYIFNWSLSILVYEIYLSIVFIMFDIFNFMLGIVNKWINKGENI